MALYPFQQKAVADALRCTPDGGRALICAPTGTGKSLILAALAAAHASLGRSVGICVHREELLAQTAERLRAAGLQFGIIAPGNTPAPHERVQLCMAQTVRRRMKTVPFDVAINDEAHRDEFSVVIKSDPRWLYGLTATPHRTDGRLGEWYGNNLITAISYSQAIEAGYIVKARVFAPDVPDLSGVSISKGDYDPGQVAEKLLALGHVGSIVDNWLANANGEKTVVFCVNVQHAERTTAEFRARGIPARCVTGETPHAERLVSMASFRAGTIRVLVNVSVYTEGLDVADASVIVLDRPTHSLTLFMQICGRGGRKFPGKQSYKVFDHTGSVFEHGSPTMDREWDLAPPEKRERKGDAAPTFKRCPKCFFVFLPGQTACPNCATPNTTRPVKHQAGKLVEVEPEAYAPVTGFIDAYQKARRKAFAEASARGVTGNRAFGLVHQALNETRAILHGQQQLIVPKNSDLLW